MASLLRYDIRCLGDCALLGGVDEAGRGALAGPVVAGAVFVDRRLLKSVWAKREMAAVNDSKQLTACQRAHFFALIERARQGGKLRAAAGIANVTEIARHNILGATRLAMGRALEAACPEGVVLPAPGGPELVFGRTEGELPTVRLLLDGKPMRPFPFAHDGVIEGDGKSFAIALASVVAKVTRDRMMEALDAVHPQFGFRYHKGYGTPRHRQALREHGPCGIHRELFLRKILNHDEPAACEEEELVEWTEETG